MGIEITRRPGMEGLVELMTNGPGPDLHAAPGEEEDPELARTLAKYPRLDIAALLNPNRPNGSG